MFSPRHFPDQFAAAMSDSRRERQERFAAGLAARQAEQLARARKLDEERIQQRIDRLSLNDFSLREWHQRLADVGINPPHDLSKAALFRLYCAVISSGRA